MYDDLEQQHIARQFFTKYGLWLIFVVVVIASFIFGIRYWQEHKLVGLTQDSQTYEEIIKKLNSDQNNKSEVLHQLEQFIEKNTNAYGVMAALDYAAYLVNKQDLAGAEKQLTLAVSLSNESNLSDISHLRLARVQAALQKRDEALANLAQVKTTGWLAQAALVRGDILLSQGKVDEAKVAYNEGLALNPSQVIAAKIKLQLDNIIT